MIIYVGNLSRQASEEQVRGLFAPFGEIKSVKLIKDVETGQLKGFAFVEMTDRVAANEAINALDSTPFMDRTLKVNEARPKQPRVYNSFSSSFGYKNRFEKH